MKIRNVNQRFLNKLWVKTLVFWTGSRNLEWILKKGFLKNVMYVFLHFEIRKMLPSKKKHC